VAINTTITTKLSKKQRSFLNIAAKTAHASELNQRHGAVIVKSGRVLAIGLNKKRNYDLVTTSKVNNGDFTVHAEIDALSRVSNPEGATIFIARVNVNGVEMLSRPCDRCAQALADARVKNIIYTV